MERANKDWRKLYFNYVRSYNKMNKEVLQKYGNEIIKKYGRGMADKKLDYWSWKNVYAGLEQEREQQQALGIRGKSLNINRDILAHQKYGISYDQGKALLKAKRTLLKNELKLLKRNNPKAKKIREELKTVNLERLRFELVDVEDVKNTAKNINKDLKTIEGYESGYDRAEYIGQLLFGS